MASWKDKVLLEGKFSMSTAKSTLFHVTLTADALFYSEIPAVKTEYKEKAVQISDVVGCHCSLDASACYGSNNSTSITIFAYPFQKKQSRDQSRHRVTITFEIEGGLTLEENRKTALQWKNVIDSLARGSRVEASDVERCEPPPWGKFLVLVNPHSGTGKAMQIFKNEVAPMFKEASIPFELCVTEYAGHANELMRNMELAKWAAVVIVSGDGLIYEVINGLMQREDWSSAIKTPVGCVPGGSGNALACSISYAAGEPLVINPVLHSTFVLIKHRVIPMDLVLVQTPTQQYYSFLSVTWGFVADADFESEKYRYLGEARFTFGALKNIVNMEAYSGKLSFLPVSKYTPQKEKAAAKMARENGTISSQGKSTNVPDTRPETTECVNNTHSPDIRSSHVSANSGIPTTDITSKTNQHDSASSVRGVTYGDSAVGMVEADRADGSTVPSNLLPSLDQPVGKDWVVIEGRFIMVCAVYQTHLGSDLLMAPFARLNDGVIHLMFVHEGISRYRLLKLLLTFSKGTHVDSPDAEFVPVLAFRLEPEEERGHIMVDGELLDPKPLQAQVLLGMGTVMGIQ